MRNTRIFSIRHLLAPFAESADQRFAVPEMESVALTPTADKQLVHECLLLALRDMYSIEYIVYIHMAESRRDYCCEGATGITGDGVEAA
jgi:hypothetical protein